MKTFRQEEEVFPGTFVGNSGEAPRGGSLKSGLTPAGISVGTLRNIFGDTPRGILGGTA